MKAPRASYAASAVVDPEGHDSPIHHFRFHLAEQAALWQRAVVVTDLAQQHDPLPVEVPGLVEVGELAEGVSDA
jgi:hypothetical protein